MQIPRTTRAKRSVRLAYVTPSHQFPTGVVLPVARRLLNWASHAGAFIIEDDHDSEFRYDGPPLQALAGLDREGRVIYVGTFSKILFPALRLGYLVLPERLVEAIAAAKGIGDTGTATQYFERRSSKCVSCCHPQGVRRPCGGLWCECRAPSSRLVEREKGGNDRGRARQSRKLRRGIVPSRFVLHKTPKRTEVVLGYASLRESEIREGIRCLAAAFR